MAQPLREGPGELLVLFLTSRMPDQKERLLPPGVIQAGSIRTMSQPGAGTMMYNSAETVKRFPGMSQSAIMPPQGSPAGAGYRTAFGAAHGFDPYAASGFVPNFAGPALASMRAGKGSYAFTERPAGGGMFEKGPGSNKRH